MSPDATGAARAFIDLHCHTSASFDSLAAPSAVVRAAAARGITHLAITDHEHIDGALEARATAEREHLPVTVIVGQEIRTPSGDMIGAFLTEPIPPGMSPAEVVATVRAQGGLVGIPHPFDRFRGSLLRDARLERLVRQVDWVEAHNARVAVGSGNTRAAELAREGGVAGIAVSDAHSAFEVGVAYTALDGDPSTPAGLLTALPTAELIPGRASFYVRLLTPVAKAVQRARGNGRIRPGIRDRPEVAGR